MTVTIRHGDCRDVLRTLPDESVHCCVTSPPYFGLRDYGVDGQIGLEDTPDAFVDEMVSVFREVKRVLRDDGTLWLNLGDSYAASGRGGNPEDSKHQKQGSNRGSRQFFQSEAVAAGVIGRKWVKPPEGYKPKDLIGVPWLVAFALRSDGWYLRQDIVWAKPNPMPESVRDRCTRSHEYIFMLSKSRAYHYDAHAIAEDAIYAGLANQDETGFKNPRSFNGKYKDGYRSSDKQRGHSRRHAGFNDRWDAMERAEQCSGKRNKRSVWNVATKPFAGAHFATFPPDLIEPCILAGCPAGGTVLDPFGGAGTTGVVADRLGRDAILIELNPDYAAIADRRIRSDAGMFAAVCSENQPQVTK
jgi:DNA modification methylase